MIIHFKINSRHILSSELGFCYDRHVEVFIGDVSATPFHGHSGRTSKFTWTQICGGPDNTKLYSQSTIYNIMLESIDYSRLFLRSLPFIPRSSV